MNTITVRPAEIKDVPRLAETYVKTWQCAYKGQIPDTYLDSLKIAERTDKWNKIISKQEIGTETFVAEIDHEIVGFCFVGYNRDDDTNKDTGELWSMYVDKHKMNAGIGTALMKKSLEFFKDNDYKKATLWVLDTNKNSREWYKHRGWYEDGKTKIQKIGNIGVKEVRYTIDL